MQYLITTFTDSTGKEHRHITKAKDNQTFTVVEAGSKEEALEMVKKPKGLLSYVPSEFGNNPISRALKASMYRKDSEWIWKF